MVKERSGEGRVRERGGEAEGGEASRRGNRPRIYSRNRDATAAPPRDTREGQEDADDDLHNSIFKTGTERVSRRG